MAGVRRALFLLASLAALALAAPPPTTAPQEEVGDVEGSTELTYDPGEAETLAARPIDPACPPKSKDFSLGVDTLQYVAIVARHGSRSPVYTYPNDPYPCTNSTFWPDGPGQLTNFGKRQMYAGGVNLRVRYKRFLPKLYHRLEVNISSNPFDRDLMSAAAFAAGLYPPRGRQRWSKDLLWQPIPVWVDNFDTVFLFGQVECPRFIQDLNRVKEEMDSDKELQWLVAELSGYQGQEVKPSMLFHAWDPVDMAKENGFKLPRWAARIFNNMTALRTKTFWKYVAGTDRMARLNAGPVLRQVTEGMVDRGRRLLYFDAAHDATLMSLFRLLGHDEPFNVRTSALLLFELHRLGTMDFVQVLYFNSSFCNEPNVVEVVGCGPLCPLTHFQRIVEERTPRDWQMECFM